MRTSGAALSARLMLAVSAWLIMAGATSVQVGATPAQHPAECMEAQPPTERDFPLQSTVRAIAAKKLNVLVMGAGSSVLPGADGAKRAYPARLQKALSERLPGVTVNVIADVKSRRTAGDMLATFAAALSAAKPALVVWQTGTVDAMLGIDPDQFSAALDGGINAARSAGADVILVNSQYSPRTESIIALSVYVSDMRWVAVQQEVPLFDRFNVMKAWANFGTFDLQSAANKLDIAERVHDCIGILLADLVVETAKPSERSNGGAR
jgi:hypothetical protein